MNLSSLTLYAGTKWSWKEAFDLYPAPSYTLKAYLKLKNNATIELTSTPDGSEHSFDVTPDITNITPGTYSVQLQAFDSEGAMSLVEASTITILPNLAVAADSREYWEQVLDEAKAAYKTLAGQVAQSVTLSNGKTITFADRKELIKIIHNAEVKTGVKPARKVTYAKFI